ncbi:DUF5301 domain-containing protein [Tissierella praeacuta]|uniref:DUF5301 domain-containing protein n=1 Tax=Tissierella praeacuta TaxID=43131 RepID=UPI001C113615|nr:DUF5301 domain-containing protein [Tissierella praeacuta]MBU5254671.1 DUF5301 domain-containing protein [Tissierella praeacuta]
MLYSCRLIYNKKKDSTNNYICGGDTINRVIKEIIILGIIAVILILRVSIDDRHLEGPNSEDLSNIILVDVIGEKGVEKITIHQQVDINKFLEIFSNAQRTSKQSISQFPNKTKFITVLYKFKWGGNSFRSMYEENGDFYIEQPFSGVFKIDSNDLYMLDQIIRNGDKEEISVLVNNMLKNNF